MGYGSHHSNCNWRSTIPNHFRSMDEQYQHIDLPYHTEDTPDVPYYHPYDYSPLYPEHLNGIPQMNARMQFDSLPLGYGEGPFTRMAQSPCPVLDEYQRGLSPESATFSTDDSSTTYNEENRTPVSCTHYNLPHTAPSGVYSAMSKVYATQLYDGGASTKIPTLVAPKDIQLRQDNEPCDEVTGVADLPDNPWTPMSMSMQDHMHPQEVVNSHSDAEDSGAAEVADAEPPHQHSDPDDDDYSPRKKRQAVTRKRTGSDSSSSHSSITRPRRGNARPSYVNNPDTSATGQKRKRGPSNGTKKSSDKKGSRQFPCPLIIYGCKSMFGTKNEWKRHMTTQHIRAGIWRCDLCPGDISKDGTVYNNDFNRKDLFVQHLRRMHKEMVPRQELVDEVRDRCYLSLRSAPIKSECLFCEESFEGKTGWEERMEHVGNHMQKDEKIGQNTAAWRKDPELERYLLEQGLILLKSQKWSLGSGNSNDEDTPDLDADADGEDDD